MQCLEISCAVRRVCMYVCMYVYIYMSCDAKGLIKRMCRIILSTVACLALPYLSILSHQQQDFQGKVIQFFFSPPAVKLLYEKLVPIPRIISELVP